VPAGCTILSPCYGMQLRAGEEISGDTMTQRIPIDWDDLEMALTMNMEESACYLNLRTGKVEISVDSSLMGDDVGPSEEEIETGVTEGYLIYIEPIESSVEYRWMAEFAESVDDPELRGKLEVALDGRGAFRRFKNVLADQRAERERWFAFHGRRLREAMDEWLTDHDIEPTTTPPR
jgi:Uncharacterised protein family (UPF0158)